MMRRIACIRLPGEDCNSPLEPRSLELLKYAGRFSPIVGLEPTESTSILLDITGLAHLFGGEPALAKNVVDDFARLGLSIRLAIADTIGAAWAATHYCRLPPSGFLIVPPGETSDFLSPFPIEALRLPEKILRLLHELGIVRIGQLEALPREDFSSRFGPVLLHRMDQAQGRLDEPVPACPIPPTFEADWSIEHPTSRRDAIEAMLERLIGRVAVMLAHAGQGVLRLECRLAFEHPTSASKPRDSLLSLGLFQPTSVAQHLFELARLQFDRLCIPAPVAHIHVTASLTAPLEPRKQRTLFDGSGENAGFACQSHDTLFAKLVERLSSRLGPDAVVRVRLRPEAQPEFSWHYDPMVEHRRRRRNVSPGELPLRPLRLLERPLPIAACSLSPDGLPLRLDFSDRVQEVVQSWGPERIETGWWRGRPVGRDYYRVETAAGRRFWLFRRLRDGKWFLHGMFD
jgi:protein ImuB